MNKISHLVNSNIFNTINQNCVIINPIQTFQKKKITRYDEQEITNLALSINLIVKHQQNIRIRKPTPSYFFGKGQISNFKIFLNKYSSKLLLINCQISPVQQRNLELFLNCKILDRTGLILEIFGERAVTKHGKIQVELAALFYQKSRLVRSWTHLERQRGGYGFMGGPGERQIESDKRQINKRISKIKKELKKIESNKLIQRRNRNKNLNPFISLVGYTNAGKSTFFNYLTKENVFVKNQLFATLDTTMRKCSISNNNHVILSDTVGFITNLPTELVISFKTTLDEIHFSDYLLHIIDISNPEWEKQKKTVEAILATILGDKYDQRKIIEIWNKSDLLNKEDLRYFKNFSDRNNGAILFSSKFRNGKEDLLKLINNKLKKNKKFLFFNFTSSTYSKKIKTLL
jgi:GTP-binding protein HflX